MDYMALSAAEWQQEYDKVSAEYESWKAKGLKLNMARGKPSKQQLDLVSGILTALTSAEECVDSGVDARNYGELKGLESARKLFADILGCKTSQVFAGGNSSLQLMYDTVSKAYTHGLLHSEKPWCKEESVKWLCPAPGYDRHFKVTENFGFELITIPMTENGPDMDIVENLIKDPSVKGMWNVPKYSNPDGIIYSDETIERIAKMKPAAPDFLLMWDNAYCIHEFDGEFVPFKDILSECEKYGNADMVFEFASTSKVTLPGVGISIGLTRLFYVLNEQGMLNENRVMAPADVMIVPMTDDLEAAVRLATELRTQNIRVQLYAEQKKFKAKIQYADKLHIPYIIFLGEDEIAAGTVSLKDLRTGEQITVPAQDASARILADMELRGQGTILK